MSDGETSASNVQKQLSRLIWRAGLKPRLTAEERRASWADERRNCMTQAGKMLRLMEEEGIAITVAGPPRNAAVKAEAGAE